MMSLQTAAEHFSTTNALANSFLSLSLLQQTQKEYHSCVSTNTLHSFPMLSLSLLHMSPTSFCFVALSGAAGDVYLSDLWCLASKQTLASVLVWTGSTFLFWAFSISTLPLNLSWLMKVRPTTAHRMPAHKLLECPERSWWILLWKCQWFWRFV